MSERASNFQAVAETAFRELVGMPEFPCLGAKAALNAGSIVLRTYEDLGGDCDSVALAADLRTFTSSESQLTSDYASFVAIFRGPLDLDEKQFEARLWQQLRKLNRIDASDGAEWDPAVASDPRDPHFSYSFAGHAFYVIGMHANSSREARRFPWPTLVFNLHEQFERLRQDEKWKHMQEAIRAREIGFEGSINPMLSDFGEESEARQYSGRIVGHDWQAPFAPVQKDK
jgi:uncharacterized protein